MPFESLQTNFSNQTYAKFKKTTHNFFRFVGVRYSICFYLYLKYQRFEIVSCGSPMSPISNPTIPINIRFFKKESCQISYNDLMIDWFSRVNLYDLLCVTVEDFRHENDIQKTTIRPRFVTSYKISI